MIKPRKRFGQNFLIDQNVIENIVHLIQPQQNDAMVEIGPGWGALTKPILKCINHLDVIEIDRDLAAALALHTLQSGQAHNITLHQHDALSFDFAKLYRQQKLRIIGNLPYNISTPLLFYLLQFAPIIQDMHFMLQQEVVDRITAQPNTKAYGRLSIMIQAQCQVQSLLTVAPDAFQPAPKVTSKIIRLIPHQTAPYPVSDFKTLQNVTTEAFNQRRKIIHNALKHYLTDTDYQKLNLDPTLRPEALSVKDFINISNYISNQR
jgi:16S rRNA (adenine1518-N6/adenine1519-N6)-dimethyltransferase